jgi:hypothetical protein
MWPKIVVGVHALASLWILVMGALHQIAVLIKYWRGTLPEPQHLGSLLAVGSGLIVAGGLMTAAIAPLLRGSTAPALLSVLALGGVIAAIAAHYGFRFLGGSIAWGSIDLLLLGIAMLIVPLSRTVPS